MFARENGRMRVSILLLVAGALPALCAADEPDWTARVAPYNGIYPALELSQTRRNPTRTAEHAIGGGSGLIAVSVKSAREDEHIALTIDIPTFGHSDRFDATLPRANVDYELQPSMDWNEPALRSLTSPHAARIEFSMRRDDQSAGTLADSVTIHPLDEALYFVRDGADTVDLSWIFAAYVNERDGVVDGVIDAAQAGGIIEHFDGYASTDPDDVYRQVWAIWHALSARGIRYSNADPAIERGPKVFSQRVRFLRETWNDRSANCIDGSVLIASVLQRIGIRSFLVLVPGHAFIGFYADADAQRAAYLETTLLGASVARTQSVPGFATAISATPQNRFDLDSFAAALAAGRARHARVAGKLDGRHRPDYAVIDIGAARAFGIQPIDDNGSDRRSGR
ncbi:MAG TPA: hypothetical protein VHW73_02395 [Rudaea sp.]|jgi:hypothetical protein|nr:hypothetical protein [Rudaea sp.]